MNNDVLYILNGIYETILNLVVILYSNKIKYKYRYTSQIIKK